ncbi:MAG: antitoxin Xre-like helix-turn-helix domain-containing protein [Rhodothermales bacterium]|nr:antitoxin Xre-like helix-turn-helix domain-containing protein [Rhodothermales bacterium]
MTPATDQATFEADLREYLAGRSAPPPAAPDASRVREGIDLATLDALRERLGLSLEELERTLHVSSRTLQRRRKAEQRLSPAESDRLWRLLHIFARALTAFEHDEQAARAWLTTPKSVLRGETPLERLDTEPGLREVEDMLTVIGETAAG